MTSSKFGPLIGAIDEGTSSARFLVFAAKTAEVLTYHQIPIKQIYPKEGWVEQCPIEILHSVIQCIEESMENLRKLDIDPSDIQTTGLTNQRETTIVWDKTTGQPLYNAIVWLDIRTTETVDILLQKTRHQNKDHLKRVCGLPISTYFSAVKLRWLLDNVPAVKSAIDEGRCLFGTVDTWLIWNLTGGVEGGIHITDVSNASRTMLMNLNTLQWDPLLCQFFDLPMSILPEIRSSSEIYGYLAEGTLRNVPISGCLGDQQSALLGQNCTQQGQAKCTYGTGCFLLYNTGTAIIQSTHGLLSTVGYRLGPNAPTIYALEGSVAVAGAAIQWLRDNLEIIADAKESEELAHTVANCGDVYFVPAFSGLYAPYWRKDARSVICGLTENTKPGHIIRAALESVCFQIHDILHAMSLDCSLPLSKLLVDGGMTNNDLLMQTQADLCGKPVVRPLMCETTALGCAMAAGMAAGINLWEIHTNAVPHDVFFPSITEDHRDMRYSRWKMAVERSLGWEPEEKKHAKWDRKQKMTASIPASLFILSTFVILSVASIINQS